MSLKQFIMHNVAAVKMVLSRKEEYSKPPPENDDTFNTLLTRLEDAEHYQTEASHGMSKDYPGDSRTSYKHA